MWEFLSNPDNQSFISVLIATLSFLVAFVSSVRNRRQYKNSIQPQLSMKLLEYKHFLYLQIKNTGKLAAKGIVVKPISIENNGYSNEFATGDLFKDSFELYPEETVQDVIARFGASLANNAFPTVTIEVSYCADSQRKKHSYRRTVSFISAYTDKISADVNVDLRNIESSLNGIARADIRTANYLDGCQVAPFDELNILARKSLANDLHETLGQKISPIKTREETIDDALSQRKAENANADT